MIFYIVTTLIVILDQLTKLWAIDQLQAKSGIKLIEGLLHFSYVENRGVAFGMLSTFTSLLPYLSLLIIVLLIYYYHKEMPDSKILRIGLAFLCGGAIGNLIDRFIRSYVVDFISIYIFGWSFPVFNVADIFVCCGSIIILLYYFFNGSKDEKEEGEN